MSLQQAVGRTLDRLGPVLDGAHCLVAYSGGPDSTALLAAVAALRAERGWRLHAAHLDHALDSDSAGRAETARHLGRRLEVPVTVARRPVTEHRRKGESVETAARRVRYAFLHEAADELGADWILTAHQRDDQAETVVLRWLFGSGLEGLAGIPERRGRILRPLLDVARGEIVEWLARRGIEPVEDPTNRDPAVPRNRVRHHLLPALETRHPDLAARLIHIAHLARAASDALHDTLLETLGPLRSSGIVSVDRHRLADLPAPLLPHALALLHRLVGAPLPATDARRELRRQLAAGGAVGWDCGGGWYWRTVGRQEVRPLGGGSRAASAENHASAPAGEHPADGRHAVGPLRAAAGGEVDGPEADAAQADEILVLERRPRPVAPFAYTLHVPGEVAIPEIQSILRVGREARQAWMLQGSKWRAGLELPVAEGERVTVRNRRAGDRLRPLGLDGERLLKELLIDRHVPRHRRDSIPLLFVGGEMAWVPGITVADAFKIRHNDRPWVARLLPLSGAVAPRDSTREENAS